MSRRCVLIVSLVIALCTLDGSHPAHAAPQPATEPAASSAATPAAPQQPPVPPATPPVAAPVAPAANALLASLRRAHGEPTAPISVQYAGTYVVEGHLRKPNDTATFAVLVTLSIRDGVVAWDSRMGPEGATAASLGNQEVGILTDAGVFSRVNNQWLPQAPVNGAAYAHTLGAFSPIALLAQAEEATADAHAPTTVHLRMPRGEHATATLDPSTRTITRIEWPRAHPRLGDVSDTIEYDGFEGRGALLFPKKLQATAHEDSTRYTMSLTLTSMPTAPDIALLNEAPAITLPAIPAPEVRVDELGQGLTAFVDTEADSRCLVMELSDGLMAFEAPVSSAVCERIIAAIGTRFPGKKLTRVAVSHYHPHYTGGIRAFVAAGCDVYATPELQAFIKTALARPFTRQPDALARAPREPVFHTVTGRTDVGDASGTVAMVDIGIRSQHTDEYTVFYFPRNKVLFQGDLGYSAPAGTLRVFPRGYGLDGALQPYGFDIATLVQSWPASTTPPLEWKTFVIAADRAARP